MSSRAGAEELEQILAIVRPAVLVIDDEFAEVAAAAVAKASPQTRLLHRDRELAAWKSEPAAPLVPVPREPDDPAFWVMTSGTTGVPKAVEHHHRNVGMCAEYYEQVLGCTSDDRLFATSRFHFAYAIGNMFAALRLGAGNILLERWATAKSVAETVERFKPTVLLSVPAVYHRLLEAGLAQTAPFRALRHFVSAGERLPPQIWTAWEEAGGHPILDGLGCSECVYMIIGNTPARRKPGSSGHAMPSVELRIVDEAGAVIGAADTPGRLEVRMPSVCEGYRYAGGALGEPPQRPAEQFRPDGWFATGDEYFRDADGFYHHRGRTGDMLRVSGIWISPSEIEDALAGQASIAESAAVLGESDIGLAEIVLYVVPAAGADGAAAVDAARERLAQALPRYKQPRRFEVVADLPRTATGKIQRHKLRELLRARSVLRPAMPTRDGNADALIRRRHVLYVEGYDPQGAEGYHNLFSRSFRRFLKNWPLTTNVSDLQIDSDDLAHWTIDAAGPNWQVSTRYDFLRQEQMIRANMAEPMWRQVPRALGWTLNYLFTGTLFRIYRASLQYGLALTTFQMMLVWWLVGFRVGRMADRLAGDGLCRRAARVRRHRRHRRRRSSASSCCVRWPIASSWCRSTAIGRICWNTRAARPSCWDRCIEAGARRLVEIARANDADEIVVVGHSGGGVTAPARGGARARARSRSRPSRPAHRAADAGLADAGHRPASRRRPGCTRHRAVAVEPSMLWIDVQARADILNFCNFDPVGGIGVDAGPARCNPLIWTVRMRDMLAPEFFKKLTRKLVSHALPVHHGERHAARRTNT